MEGRGGITTTIAAAATTTAVVSILAVASVSVLTSYYYYARKERPSKLLKKKDDGDNNVVVVVNSNSVVPMIGNDLWFFGRWNLFRNFVFPTTESELSTRSNILKNCCNRWGQFGLKLLPFRKDNVVFVTHYEDAIKILSTEYYRRAPKPIPFKHIAMFLGPKNIGLLYGKEWKIHRLAIHKSLNNVMMLNESKSIMVDIASIFTKSLRFKISYSSKVTTTTTITTTGLVENNQNGISSEAVAGSNDDYDGDDGSSSSSSSSSIELTILPLMKLITIDIFAKTALSVDLNCCKSLEPNNKVAIAFDFLLEELGRRMSNLQNLSNFFYMFPTTQNRIHANYRHFLRSFLLKLIEERQKEQQAPEEKQQENIDHNNKEGNNGTQPEVEKNMMMKKKDDLLSKLLEAHMDCIDSSEQALDDTLMALLFAGYDTTSVTLTYALYCLSQHREIEKHCLEEIKLAFSSSPIPALDELAYCQAVLYETLRLYPPGTFTNRTLQKPVKLRGGVEVPEGTRVFVPIEIIQNSERHFPNPTEFIPERWVEESSTSGGCRKWKERRDIKNEKANHLEQKDSRSTNNHTETRQDDDGACPPNNKETIPAANRGAFLAFSAGGRSCPGQKFATQEATLVLAVLIRDLEFHSLPGYKLQPKRSSLVQCPHDGLPMKIKARIRSETHYLTKDRK